MIKYVQNAHGHKSTIQKHHDFTRRTIELWTRQAAFFRGQIHGPLCLHCWTSAAADQWWCPKLYSTLQTAGVQLINEKQDSSKITVLFDYRSRQHSCKLQWGTFDGEIELLQHYYLGNLDSSRNPAHGDIRWKSPIGSSYWLIARAFMPVVKRRNVLNCKINRLSSPDLQKREVELF